MAGSPNPIDDADSGLAAANPVAPGEPQRDKLPDVEPVPGVHKETRDHRAGHPGAEGGGHSGGGGRDHS